MAKVATHLKKHGIHSIVAIPEGEDDYAKMLRELNISCYRISSLKRIKPSMNPFTHLKWLFFFPLSVFALIRLIRKCNVDIVQTGVSPVYLQGPIAAKLAGAKLIWYLEGVGIPLPLSGLIRILLIPFFYTLGDRIVCASEAVSSFHLSGSTLGKNSMVIYPPVDTAQFKPDVSSIDEYRKKFGIEPGEKIVGIVGNINPAKGYEFFFRAIKTIKEQAPDTRFLVVGTKLDTQETYWQTLKAQIEDMKIEDDIIFTGYRNDIAEIMNVMDIFALTSVVEAAPIVIMEAMACARPIVATRVGGIPELIEDGDTGIIVPPRDSEAIADAILHLLNSPEEAQRMGINARERAIGHFDVEISARKHRKIYQSVLKQSRT